MTDIEEANDIRLLNLLEKTLEADIFNYALERTEDLLDEDEDEIVRALFWSVGVEEYCVVVTPLGCIKEAMKTKTEEGTKNDGTLPSDLLLQVFNSIQLLTHRCYEPEE